MKITALVENESTCDLKGKHGLSLYIETVNHKILFDLGPDTTLFDNAKRKQIDLSTIDIVILSHGHNDHGGALKQFLQLNKTAKVYVQRKAFESHYAKVSLFKLNIGLDKSLLHHPQIHLLDGDYTIDDKLQLFVVHEPTQCLSTANDCLYTEKRKDDFSHEQNLIIKEQQTTLIMGCGHAGVVNIMQKAEGYHPDVCVGGYHLFNPLTKKTVSPSLLEEIALKLTHYPQTTFYTCHCTGQEAYRYLSSRLANMHYLTCGETIEV